MKYLPMFLGLVHYNNPIVATYTIWLHHTTTRENSQSCPLFRYQIEHVTFGILLRFVPNVSLVDCSGSTLTCTNITNSNMQHHLIAVELVAKIHCILSFNEVLKLCAPGSISSNTNNHSGSSWWYEYFYCKLVMNSVQNEQMIWKGWKSMFIFTSLETEFWEFRIIYRVS